MIATESRDGITIVRLDRPAQRNALIPALVEALIDGLKRALLRIMTLPDIPTIYCGTEQSFTVWRAG